MSKWIKVQVPDEFDITDQQDKDSVRIEGIEIPVFEPVYKQVLDHGYLALIDFMGSDEAIAEAARVSYQKGTKKVSGTEGLIRYLLRHRHTTPFEMCEVKFHVKLPIFVERQWIRHRTASVNEMSARYSILDNEMYIPDHEHTAPQSTNNKQGRAGGLSDNDYLAVGAAMEQVNDDSYGTYMYLLGQNENGDRVGPPDAINVRKLHADASAMNALMKIRDDKLKKGETWEPTSADIEAKRREFYDAHGLAITTDEYPGIARELARMVLPLSTYTQKYWKTNLWNLFNFLRLRLDAHAQYEIRAYAEAIYEQIQPLFPLACKAFDDYIRDAKTFSKNDLRTIALLLNEGWWPRSENQVPNEERFGYIRQIAGSEFNMSGRELDELIAWIKEAVPAASYNGTQNDLIRRMESDALAESLMTEEEKARISDV